MTWLTDKNGNRCSIGYFGTREAAQKALDSLKDCLNCINCSRCSRCSDCSDCFRCSDCSGCFRCFRCSVCSDCFHCSDCSDLKGEKKEPVSIPKIENIHAAIYAAASQPNALKMSDWHTCKNTHCRAGWAVTLAGKEGKELEARFDTCLAAMMIYEASGYKISPVRFNDSNEEALADMKKLAET